MSGRPASSTTRRRSTLGALLLLTLAAACGPGELPADGRGTVVGVVDGDTVVVDLDGTAEMIRLLGIDTP